MWELMNKAVVKLIKSVYKAQACIRTLRPFRIQKKPISVLHVSVGVSFGEFGVQLIYFFYLCRDFLLL